MHAQTARLDELTKYLGPAMVNDCVCKWFYVYRASHSTLACALFLAWSQILK